MISKSSPKPLIAATTEIARLELSTRVLALTTFGTDAAVYAAMQAGASGYLLKTEAPDRLVSGIRSIASGDSLLSASITQKLISQFVRRPAPPRHISRLRGTDEVEPAVVDEDVAFAA